MSATSERTKRLINEWVEEFLTNNANHIHQQTLPNINYKREESKTFLQCNLQLIHYNFLGSECKTGEVDFELSFGTSANNSSHMHQCELCDVNYQCELVAVTFSS